MAKNQKKRAGKPAALIILGVILGLILIGMVVLWAFTTGLLNRINRPDDTPETLTQEEIDAILAETDATEENYTGEVVEPEDVVLSDLPADPIEAEDEVLNILLIGQDRREGQGRQRSDSMILCTINVEEKTLVMTSFLRDLYVEIPDWNGNKYSDNRLNVNYVFGGMEMLDACLELNFGIQVDYNMEVDFSGFKEMIDLMGGVDIELTKREANYLGDGLVEGVNHLTGEQALAYSRIRYLDSDFGRTNRQRTVLTALLNQVKDSSLTELYTLIEQVLPMITTDMDNSEITSCALKLFPILPDLQVTTQHIPAEGTYKMCVIRGMSVLVPDMEANRQILKDTIG